MSKITDHVADGKMVHFQHYQDGTLWYRCDSGFEFPIPVSDTGTGLFGTTEKSVYCMRWIRKHLELIESAKAEQAAEIDLTPDETG